jgi:hypothetical protein
LVPDVPVVVWALTTTPEAMVVDVLAVVVLVVVVSVALAAAAVAGSALGFGDALADAAVSALSVDCEVPTD